MKLIYIFNDQTVTTKNIPSKKNPGTMMEFPQQSALVKDDSTGAVLPVMVTLPRSRNGKPFEAGQYEVPVTLGIDYGEPSVRIALEQARLLAKPSVAKAA